MESFDQKIKSKLSSFEYIQAPSESEMSNMFERLDNQQTSDAKVVELAHDKDNWTSFRLLLRIAAGFALILTLGFAIYQINEVNVYAVKGSNQEHHLPDGSVVQLNADSKLDYNKIVWMGKRVVSLEGEGFFEVKKGEKFTINSGLGSTSVLGTSFNVFSRGQDYKVECFTGSVSVVYHGNNDAVILSAGRGVEYGTLPGGKIVEFNGEERKDWRSGEFYFENEYLKNVFGELSRQYNIEVRLDSKYNDIKYTGYFNDKNLEIALKLICDPLDLKYKIQDGHVIIK